MRQVCCSGVLLAGLVALAALGGCDSNPTPKPLPKIATSHAPAPSASSDPTPPALPAEARGTSAKSAKAFVRFYVDLVNRATVSGDVSGLREMSSPRCNSCAAVIDRIHGVYKAGGAIRSHGWRINVMTVVPRQPRMAPVIDVGLALSPQKVVTRAGAEPKQFKGGRLPATFHLSRTGGNWIVYELERSA